MSLREGNGDKSPPVCYSFRDNGTCKFGENCKFSHVKKSSQQKFQHKANAAQVLEQYMVNLEHDQALKFQEYKKKLDKRFDRKLSFYKKDKMKPYKKKLEIQNSKFAAKDKVNLAEEEKPEDQVAAAAKVLEEEIKEDSSSGGSDLSELESESEDQ
jgi:hypothetical protein